jgi:hypothetical protein
MRQCAAVLAVLLLEIFSTAAFGQSLKLDGTTLYYQQGGKSLPIRKLEAKTDFYGFDLMDKTHVFIAYQMQGYAEAVAVMAIYDVETGKEQKIGELGGAGESHFTYNRENKLVLYNIDDGMYALEIADPRAGSFAKPVLILRQPAGKSFYNPSWIDARTFRYEAIDSRSGHTTIKSFTLPDSKR